MGKRMKKKMGIGEMQWREWKTFLKREKKKSEAKRS